MNEAQALAVTAVWVLETEAGADRDWNDARRARSSQGAAAAVGEGASPQAFLAERARLALQSIGQSYPGLPAAIRALGWRPWIGPCVLALAFGAGLLADHVGQGQRINVLAPPVLLLLCWNLLVYLLVAIRPLTHWKLPQAATDLLASAGAGLQRRRRPRGSLPGSWSLALSARWAGIAAPLYQVRAARLLHSAAALLALGMIAGLYLRGLALEYRATWESTFLDPQAVQSMLSVVLAPGAWLARLPLPDLARVGAIRAPEAENAAYWLHLMASTLGALVVLPRLLLALHAYWKERKLARALPLPLGDPYFRRLLRGLQAQPRQVVVIPYGYTPAAAALTALGGLLERLWGGAGLELQLCAPVPYGAGATDALSAVRLPGACVLLFNMAATPEREVHAAFAAQVLEHLGGHEPPLVVVDETGFAVRSGADPQRMQQRRAAWQELLATVPVVPAFINLGQPDVERAGAALEAALADAGRTVQGPR